MASCSKNYSIFVWLFEKEKPNFHSEKETQKPSGG